jgi:hypothetical protein
VLLLLLHIAGADFLERFAQLEAKMNSVLPLAEGYLDLCQYTPSVTSTVTGREPKFKAELVKAYSGSNRWKKKKEIYCMLTQEFLPSEAVTAAHLFRFSWAE